MVSDISFKEEQVKRRSTKGLAAVGLVAAAALGLAACSSGSGNDSGSHSVLQTLVSSDRVFPLASGPLPKSVRIRP